jgi:adenosylcobinamide-phosphate synthase
MTLLLAFLLDLRFGEVRKFHPLVGFGFLSNALEAWFNPDKPDNQKLLFSPQSKSQLSTKLLGIFCWILLVFPLPLIYCYLHQDSWLFYCLDIIIVYFAIGYNSLVLHAKQILKPLMNKDLSTARHFCSYIVSRNTQDLNEQEIARATTESVLENGHDAVIATLVWFAIGGAPLVLVHRLANTLDAMWGYKNPHFIYFGWFSARIDDLLGWPSAKISSFLYALQGHFFAALKNGFIQGRQYKSLNGGWVMATGATVLNIKLGGCASYHGKQLKSVELGCGEPISTAAIAPSLQLVKTAAWLFIGVMFVINFIV